MQLAWRTARFEYRRNIMIEEITQYIRGDSASGTNDTAHTKATSFNDEMILTQFISSASLNRQMLNPMVYFGGESVSEWFWSSEMIISKLAELRWHEWHSKNQTLWSSKREYWKATKCDGMAKKNNKTKLSEISGQIEWNRRMNKSTTNENVLTARRERTAMKYWGMWQLNSRRSAQHKRTERTERTDERKLAKRNNQNNDLKSDYNSVLKTIMNTSISRKG